MTFQNILTLSIDAIALSFVALMAIDFAFTLAAAWCKCGNHKTQGMCAETLAPIFEDIPEVQEMRIGTVKPIFEDVLEVEMCTKKPLGAHLLESSIRDLKKQASVAKIKNYSVLTKAQLVEALAA